MAEILRSNRSLRRLLGAWAQSCLGTSAGYVALLLLTYRHLHTSWAVAAVLLVDFLPVIAFGSLFGLLADRYSCLLYTSTEPVISSPGATGLGSSTA